MYGDAVRTYLDTAAACNLMGSLSNQDTKDCVCVCVCTVPIEPGLGVKLVLPW